MALTHINNGETNGGSFVDERGRNSSLVVFGLSVHSVAGSTLLWGKFSGRGDFSLGVNMVSNSIPPKTLSDESINRGLVCAHMHSKRSWRSCPRRMNAGNKNTPSEHHPRRRNVTTLMVGLKKTVTYAKISPRNGEPQRYSWGTQKKKKMLMKKTYYRTN